MRRLKNRVDGLAVLVGGVLSLGMIACTQGKSNAATPAGAATEMAAAVSKGVGAVGDSSAAAGFGMTRAAESAGSAPKINATRAMQYTKEVTAFGARPIGSANHKKLEDYIVSHLKGDEVDFDAFTADTIEGKFPVRNIIAKFPGTKDGIIVIAGHYDTNYPLRDTGYVGANDGGSSTAILLEFANQLRGKKREGYSVWLLWTDGEEAVRNWTSTDSLYGTRHLGAKWEKDGHPGGRQ